MDDDDYDVLADGGVVGRIMKADEGSPRVGGGSEVRGASLGRVRARKLMRARVDMGSLVAGCSLRLRRSVGTGEHNQWHALFSLASMVPAMTAFG
jgi:hypothetical protein